LDFAEGEISSILAALRGYLITLSAAPPLSYAAQASRSNIGIFHQTERRLTSYRSGDIARARKRWFKIPIQDAEGLSRCRNNRSGAYLITDGGSQAWAIVTHRGVILVDVPEPLPFRPPLRVVPAIAEITDKPITHLI
jgi:hypothetical protein